MVKKIKTTKKQARAVGNILSGRFKTRAEAMREAGYAKTTSHRPAEKLLRSKGVSEYIKSLGVAAQKRWNLSLPDKVAMTFLEGLDATKLVGKDATVHPDWQARLAFADRFADLFGWNKGKGGEISQQFTFFAQSPESKIAFNEEFKKFLASYYGDKDDNHANNI